MKIYLNGKLVPEKKAVVSVFDHGLLYGDGVFEGIRSYNSRVFMLEEHIDRLFRSAKAIALEIPISKKAVCDAVVKTCKVNKVFNGYVRLVVTRGVGALGLNPFNCARPQIIVIATSLQLYPKELYERGMSIVTVPTVRNMAEALNPNIKSLNYLNNILAKIEAINAGTPEAIMLNARGFVAEATGDNVFVVKGRTLMTPPSDAGVLVGITREVVMGLARQEGLEVCEKTMTRYDLYTADEVFLTGTAAEVIGVTEIDRRSIGEGRPGEVTRMLTSRFRSYAAANGTPIR